MTSATILIADEDAETRNTLRAGFEAEGWAVLEARDRKSLFESVESAPVDLVTLDLTLGKDCALKLAPQLRAKRNIPILIITGQTEPYDRVRGLEAGADDYIAKPFHIREVIFRVKRTLEHYSKAVHGDQSVFFDHSEFDLKRKSVVHLDGTPIELTGFELRLLELFIRHPGRVLSRDEISQFLRGREWSPYDRTIDGHVARLRRKIEPPDDPQPLIHSVRGVGYVFVGDVKSVPLPGGPAPA